MSMNFKFKVGKKTVSVLSEYTHPVVLVDGDPIGYEWIQPRYNLSFPKVEFEGDKADTVYIITDGESEIKAGDMIEIWLNNPRTLGTDAVYGLVDIVDGKPWIHPVSGPSRELPEDWREKAAKIALFSPRNMRLSGEIPTVEAKAG